MSLGLAPAAPVLLDPDEVDVEYQHAERRPDLAFVGQLLRNPEERSFPFHHELHAFCPPWDHVGQGEREWHATQQ